jgi:hypothetical protein
MSWYMNLDILLRMPALLSRIWWLAPRLCFTTISFCGRYRWVWWWYLITLVLMKWLVHAHLQSRWLLLCQIARHLSVVQSIQACCGVHPPLYSVGTRAVFIGKGLKYKADHSLLSRAVVKCTHGSYGNDCVYRLELSSLFGQIAELDFSSRIVGKGQVNVRKQSNTCKWIEVPFKFPTDMKRKF